MWHFDTRREVNQWNFVVCLVSSKRGMFHCTLQQVARMHDDVTVIVDLFMCALAADHTIIRGLHIGLDS